MAPIKLTLKTLDKTTYIEYIDEELSILDLKKQIQTKHNFLIENIKLLYLGKTLENNILINNLNYTEKSFIVLFITKNKKNNLSEKSIEQTKQSIVEKIVQEEQTETTTQQNITEEQTIDEQSVPSIEEQFTEEQTTQENSTEKQLIEEQTIQETSTEEQTTQETTTQETTTQETTTQETTTQETTTQETTTQENSTEEQTTDEQLTEEQTTHEITDELNTDLLNNINVDEFDSECEENVNKFLNIMNEDESILELLISKQFDTNILPVILHAIAEKDDELADYILSNPSNFFMRLMTRRAEEMNSLENSNNNDNSSVNNNDNSNVNYNLVQHEQLSENGQILKSMFPDIDDYIINESLQVCDNNIDIAAGYLSDYFVTNN